MKTQKLVVLHTKEKDPRLTFEWLAADLKEKGNECKHERFKICRIKTYAMYHTTQSCPMESFGCYLPLLLLEWEWMLRPCIQ